MFKRWQSGLWGVLSFSVMAALVVSALVLLEMPPAVVWGGALFAGVLLVLTTIGAIRGSQRRRQGFSAFDSNALSNPVNEEFQAPYNRTLAFVPGETALVQCAPIQQVTTSLGDLLKPGSWGLLGKGKTTNAENALVLTQKRLVFLMIGPDALKRYCANPRVTRILEAVPGDASAKRLALWRSGGAEVRTRRCVGRVGRRDSPEPWPQKFFYARLRAAR